MEATSPQVLGIDVGTSALKVVLVNARGQMLAEAAVSYQVHSAHAGWAEQDPESWWSGLEGALAELWGRGYSGKDVAAIGLTGQMHSLVVLGSDGQVLCPAILWSDQRTVAECVAITDSIGKDELLRQTGNVALTGFTAPKILWVRSHWPEAYAKADMFLLPKDFVRHRLTGVYATDMSDASGTLLLNVRARQWALDLVHELRIDETRLPPLVEGNAIVGSVVSSVASRLGLRAGTPVVAGGGDNAAAAVGLGAVDPGIVTLSIGSSGVMFAPLTEYPEVVDGRLHVFCHALPSRWHLMSVTLAAGGSLRWLREVLSQMLPVELDQAYSWLIEQAADVPPGSGGVVFLPYISGERTPYADPNARGVFYGLHAGTRLGHLVRSVLEGVAFSQRQGLDLIRQAGATVSSARGAGGGLASQLWCQILVDTLGIGLQLAEPSTGAARGAAVLAGIGVDLFPTEGTGIDWASEPVMQPDHARARVLEAAFRTYVELYPSLRGLFATS
jgi:xylulokinase